MEEANANVTGLELYTVFSLPHISQIYMFFLSELNKPEFSSGEESLEVKLFSEDEIPGTHYLFQLLLRLWSFSLKIEKQVISQSDISTCYSSLDPNLAVRGISEKTQPRAIFF